MVPGGDREEPAQLVPVFTLNFTGNSKGQISHPLTFTEAAGSGEER